MSQTQSIRVSIDNIDPVLSSPNASLSALQKDQRLQLFNALHASLDLETIISQFAIGIMTEVPCDGLLYTFEDEDISVREGTTAPHRFKYQLDIADEYLGDILFEREAPFNNDEILSIEDLLCLLLFPLRNALTHHKAVKTALIDPLTGIANRTQMQTSINQEIDLAKRHNLPLCVMTLDLDNFKQVNDTHGHAAGDEVLKTFTQSVLSIIRDSDLFFRVGGEEFVLIIRQTDRDGAYKLGQRICELTYQTPCTYKDKAIQMSVSGGIGVFDENDSHDLLLEKSDMALYRAKSSGKNKISF